MLIRKKEVIKFSEKELEALNLVTNMVEGIIRGAESHELLKTAHCISNGLGDLWMWVEDEE